MIYEIARKQEVLEKQPVAAGCFFRMFGQMNDIMVSICCIAYNQEQYIRQTLESFLSQKTDFAIEIVIHDDASTDRTAEIIREYELKYPDLIRAMYQQQNQYSKGVTNPSGAFNYPRARGKYIAMCEGDDYWIDENKLQKQVSYMEAHPKCSMCCHSAKVEVVDGSYTEATVRPYKQSKIIPADQIIDKKSGIPTASLLFRTSLVQPVPDYYTKCPVGDIPLQLLFASKGSVYYFDEMMSVYRIGDKESWTVRGRSGDYPAKQETYYLRMKEMYESFDMQTGYRYHESIERAVKRLRFLTYVNTKQYSYIFAREYREFYSDLSFHTRFFIRFEYHLPGIYRAVRMAARKWSERKAGKWD